MTHKVSTDSRDPHKEYFVDGGRRIATSFLQPRTLCEEPNMGFIIYSSPSKLLIESALYKDYKLQVRNMRSNGKDFINVSRRDRGAIEGIRTTLRPEKVSIMPSDWRVVHADNRQGQEVTMLECRLRVRRPRTPDPELQKRDKRATCGSRAVGSRSAFFQA